jgi:hypothetical protein
MSRYRCAACGGTVRVPFYCENCRAMMHRCTRGWCPTLILGDAVTCRFHSRTLVTK